MEHSPDREDERYAAVRQYSLAQILGVWAAAAVPMGVLAWVVAPLLRDQLGGDEPLAEALLICLTAGLIWQFVLVLILIRRELGGLQWSRVREALWLRPPRDPKTGRVGGRVWWWVLLFVLIFGLEQVLPAIPGPSVRDFADFLSSDRGEDFFRGAWGWFAVIVVLDVRAVVVSAKFRRGVLRMSILDQITGWLRKLGGASESTPSPAEPTTQVKPVVDQPGDEPTAQDVQERDAGQAGPGEGSQGDGGEAGSATP